MIKRFLKKSWPFLISLAGISTLTILACAGGDWSGMEGSMFTPDIIRQPKYMPFFRTQATPFYDGYDDESADIFKAENSKDWQAYLDHKISKEGMDYWLYTASLNQVDSMIFDMKNKPSHLTEASKRYSLKPAGDKAITFLYYLGFARRNETFTAIDVSYDWSPKPENTTIVSIERQIAGGISFLAKAKDNFMKERYAFQLERLYFFNKEYDKAIATYDANEAYFTSANNIKWRAFSYKAGALYRKEQYAEANYLFSRIYDAFDPLKKSAYLCFHPQQQQDWNACLALAKNTREKEVLWQLFGLYADATLAMREILKLNPRSEMADLLLVRAVNKEEEKFEGNLTMATINNSSFKNPVDKELTAFLDERSSVNTGANPVVWHLAAAYLNYIQRNYEIADKQLKRAQEGIKNDGLLKAQYHLISLVGKIGRIGTMSPDVENELLPDLKVVFESKNAYAGFRVYDALDWMRQTLARYAESNGESQKAELIFPGINRSSFKRITNLEKMIAYYDKPNRSGYEKLFFDNALLSRTDYVELKAIRYAHQDKLEEALKTFRSLPSPGEDLPGNPFNIHIRDCHDCDHEAPQKVKYNRITFLEKMLEMKKVAATKPAEAAQNYFLIANGFYNITYFGNARQFYGYNHVDGDFYYYGDSAEESQVDQALKYYLLARQNSGDKEFKAKCTFMAAKCELNTYYLQNQGTDDFKAGVYFANLKRDYATTNYYKEVIKECGYFRTYLGKK